MSVRITLAGGLCLPLVLNFEAAAEIAVAVWAAAGDSVAVGGHDRAWQSERVQDLATGCSCGGRLR